MATRVLGIDVGTNSIGWALVRLQDEQDHEDSDVEAIGVRIFHEAVEPKDRKPKNAARRQRRLLRRQIRRRAQRRRAIAAVCTRHGLLPEDPGKLHALLCDFSRNPFLLRAKALDEPLGLHELGRVMLHLGAHRGYKSNRKALLSKSLSDPEIRQAVEELEEERRQKAIQGRLSKEERREEEEGVVLQAIAALESQMREAGSRTLGEHLWRQLQQGGRARRSSTETANYTREMVEQEFERIWESQRRFHPHLTESLKATLHRAIFFQRPLRIRHRGVEACPFENGRNRAFKAQVISERFRAWHTAKSLRWRPADPREDWRDLNHDQVRAVADLLMSTPEVDRKRLRKLLKLPEDVEFNLLRDDKDTLKGAESSLRLRKILGDAWDQLDDLEKDELIHELIHSDSIDALAKRLVRKWRFDPKTVYRLITTELPSGTASLSAKAMRKLLPRMQAGERYDEACLYLYGRYGPRIQDATHLSFVPMPSGKANPVVMRSLVEVRRIVNAVIDRFGKPDEIHVEASRELKLTKKEREKLQTQQRRNEKANDEARKKFRNLFPGREPSRADLERYRLWKESGGQCPYTGRAIGLEELFRGDSVDVEHIIPLPRCWDDSFRNKTICDATFNRLRKKNRTPREALTADELASVVERLGTFPAMPLAKKRLFTLEWDHDTAARFTNRQMNDTSIATTLVRRMLVPIFGDTRVLCLPGKLTALLRRHWGMDTVLGGDGKNREDHRHHAVDAVVIALTSRSIHQRLATLRSRLGDDRLEQILKQACPVRHLRQRMEDLLERVVVSHQPTRRARGGFTEETAYGKVGAGEYVYRKPIGNLSAKEVEKVRDLGLRRRLQEIAKQEEERADKKLDKPFEELAKRNPDRPVVLLVRKGREQVVRRVRLKVNASDESLVSAGTAYYASAANHHVAVFAVGDERRYVLASLYQVYQRLRQGKPVYDRQAIPGGRFLFAWHPNDTVCVEARPEKYYRIVKFSDLDPELHRKIDLLLRPVWRATESKGALIPSKASFGEDVRCKSPSTLKEVGPPISMPVLGLLE
ncbi:MAG: type II CRISPR RNA-guided endonuclease Cas9 [Fimbriimonadales bacterium]|nr:type II CRISPR RNA-guided endonuclease Cas9 [Fimbriimonadales bacterium]